MAEVKPADPNRPAEGSARVVPLGAARAQPGRAEPDGVSWTAFRITVVLLVFAAAALIVQTQRVANRNERIGVLSGQVAGLESQLRTANAQLATYHAQLARIRSTVSTVADQVATLAELVADPFAEPAPPAPAEATPER